MDTGHWSVDIGHEWGSKERNDCNRMHRWTTNGSTDKILPINGKKRGQRERTGNINYFMKEVINLVYNV